jgi:hypothetical protein
VSGEENIDGRERGFTEEKYENKVMDERKA